MAKRIIRIVPEVLCLLLLPILSVLTYVVLTACSAAALTFYTDT